MPFGARDMRLCWEPDPPTDVIEVEIDSQNGNNAVRARWAAQNANNSLTYIITCSSNHQTVSILYIGHAMPPFKPKNWVNEAESPPGNISPVSRQIGAPIDEHDYT